jgi:hypothetical protein
VFSRFEYPWVVETNEPEVTKLINCVPLGTPYQSSDLLLAETRRSSDDGRRSGFSIKE